jgi:hypothetical protein
MQRSLFALFSNMHFLKDLWDWWLFVIYAISSTSNNTQMDLSLQNGEELPELDLEYTDKWYDRYPMYRNPWKRLVRKKHLKNKIDGPASIWKLPVKYMLPSLFRHCRMVFVWFNHTYDIRRRCAILANRIISFVSWKLSPFYVRHSKRWPCRS